MPHLHDGVEHCRSITIGDFSNDKLDHISILNLVPWRDIKVGSLFRFNCAFAATAIDPAYTKASILNVLIREASCQYGLVNLRPSHNLFS
jgi:hypothetical protein